MYGSASIFHLGATCQTKIRHFTTLSPCFFPLPVMIARDCQLFQLTFARSKETSTATEVAILAIRRRVRAHTLPAARSWLQAALRINLYMHGFWRCSGANKGINICICWHNSPKKASTWSVFEGRLHNLHLVYGIECFIMFPAGLGLWPPKRKTRALLPMTHQYTVVQWCNNRNSVKNTKGWKVCLNGVFSSLSGFTTCHLASRCG